MAFTLRILRQKRVKPFVISVGNVTMGGSGKTPFTLALASILEKDRQVAILSRGYKAESSLKEPLCLDSKNKQSFSALQTGDEPFLFASRLCNSSIYIHPSRVLSAKKAEAQKAEVLLLDDGRQHRYLARDKEILLIGGEFPLGLKELFPAGFLRESLAQLYPTDLVVLHNLNEEQKAYCRTELGRRLPAAPILHSKTVVEGIFTEQGPLSLTKRTFGAFCGIAHPKAFLRTLEKEGIQLAFFESFEDHAHLSEQELFLLERQALEAEVTHLICTEKDWVKLSRKQGRCTFCYLKISWEVEPESQKLWEHFLSSCKQALALREENSPG